MPTPEKNENVDNISQGDFKRRDIIIQIAGTTVLFHGTFGFVMAFYNQSQNIQPLDKHIQEECNKKYITKNN